MVFEGHCNCGSVRVELPEQPPNSVLCYCDNCRRSGGPCSANFAVQKSDITLKDPKGVLKKYLDSNTTSGNTITRRFCGNCGSPVMTMLSKEEPYPDLVFVKASLFDNIPAPNMEVYSSKKWPWVPEIEGSKLV